MKRRHLIVGIILFSVLLLIGTFKDYEINSTVYMKGNWFGVIMATFGPIVSYQSITFVAGITLYLIIHKYKSLMFKLCGIAIICALSFVSIYYGSKDIISVNGLNQPGKYYISLPIGITLSLLFIFLGYKFGKNVTSEYAWFYILCITVITFLVLVPEVTLLKNIMHRPRFRYLLNSGNSDLYHRWYEPFKEYKNYITDIFTKEEFKSFPSGHTVEASLVVVLFTFLPFMCEKVKKYQTLLVYCALTFTLVMGFSRLTVGAHFLSDISMGALLSLITTLIINEIVIIFNKKKKVK